MDVYRCAARVGPECGVDLFGFQELRKRRCHALQQWAELLGLVLVELPYVGDVPLRLDDQSADTERPDAVLDNPVWCLGDSPPGSTRSPAVSSHARQPSTDWSL
jgi:hypothetical protein